MLNVEMELNHTVEQRCVDSMCLHISLFIALQTL